MGNRKPDYTGVWDASTGTKSVFYMLVDAAGDSSITGRIFDDFGEALFNGKILKDSISFKKQYSPVASSQACDKPIFYKGILGPDGSYSGKFHSRSEHCNGTFILEHCPNSKTIEFLFDQRLSKT